MKYLIFGFLLLFLGPTSLAQETPRQIAHQVKEQIADQKKEIQDNESRRVELLKELDNLDRHNRERKSQIEKLNRDLVSLEREADFQESHAFRVLDIFSASTVVIQIEKEKRFVLLAGITIEDDAKAEQFLRKRLLRKEAYLRCLDSTCAVAYLYLDKDGPSINAQLLQSGLAKPLAAPNFNP